MALSFDLRLVLSLLYVILSEGAWLLCHLVRALRFLASNSLIYNGIFVAVCLWTSGGVACLAASRSRQIRSCVAASTSSLLLSLLLSFMASCSLAL